MPVPKVFIIIYARIGRSIVSKYYTESTANIEYLGTKWISEGKCAVKLFCAMIILELLICVIENLNRVTRMDGLALSLTDNHPADREAWSRKLRRPVRLDPPLY